MSRAADTLRELVLQARPVPAETLRQALGLSHEEVYTHLVALETSGYVSVWPRWRRAAEWEATDEGRDALGTAALPMYQTSPEPMQRLSMATTRTPTSHRILAWLQATTSGAHQADICEAHGLARQTVSDALCNLLGKKRIISVVDQGPGKAHNRRRYFAAEHQPTVRDVKALPRFCSPAERKRVAVAHFTPGQEADTSRAIFTRYVAPSDPRAAPCGSSRWPQFSGRIGKYEATGSAIERALRASEAAQATQAPPNPGKSQEWPFPGIGGAF